MWEGLRKWVGGIEDDDHQQRQPDDEQPAPPMPNLVVAERVEARVHRLRQSRCSAPEGGDRRPENVTEITFAAPIRQASLEG